VVVLKGYHKFFLSSVLYFTVYSLEFCNVFAKQNEISRFNKIFLSDLLQIFMLQMNTNQNSELNALSAFC